MIYLINNHLMKIQTDNPHVVASALVELSDRFGGKMAVLLSLESCLFVSPKDSESVGEKKRQWSKMNLKMGVKFAETVTHCLNFLLLNNFEST